MTQEDILEYNKMCAEFLGYVNTTSTDKEFNVYQNKDGKILEVMSMKFHTDWNLIMEIVETIHNLDRLSADVMICQSKCKITPRMAGDNSVYADVSKYFLQGIKGQKEAVVEAINHFLKFYINETEIN